MAGIGALLLLGSRGEEGEKAMEGMSKHPKVTVDRRL
jgi:hypothetical protein